MVNVTLAEFSNRFVYAAMVTYTIAMITFAVAMAATRGRDLVPAVAASAEQQSGGVAVATRVETAVGGPNDGALAPGRRSANIAMSITWLATVLLGVGVLLRGLSVGRVPWGNMYEFSVTSAFAVPWPFLSCLSSGTSAGLASS